VEWNEMGEQANCEIRLKWQSNLGPRNEHKRRWCWPM